MAFGDFRQQIEIAGRAIVVALMTLLLTAAATASVLRVPEDFAAIQPAMDASAVGDTVVVARGTWAGLLESPAHSLTLCSRFLFSQDSADVLETILDAEYQGTLLEVNTVGTNVFHVYGLTLIRGQGQQTDVWVNCDRGGAIHVCEDGNLSLRSSILAHNRAPRQASVLFFARECATTGSSGSLTLQNLYLEDNYEDSFEDNLPAIKVVTRNSHRAVLENLRYNGSGQHTSPIIADFDNPEELSVRDVEIWDCDGGFASIWAGVGQTGDGSTISRVSCTGPDSLLGCRLSLGFYSTTWQDLDVTCYLHDIELAGLRDPTRSAYFGFGHVRGEFNQFNLHHCRSAEELLFWLSATGDLPRGVIHGLDVHHNVVGDSTTSSTVFPNRMVMLRDCDIDGAHLHDNRVIIRTPVEGPLDESPGGSLDGCILYAYTSQDGSVRRFENILCENNLVEDLDDYSNLFPEVAPAVNNGRDMYLRADSLIEVHNVTIRNSRQPNHAPELYAPAYLTYSTSGSCLYVYSPKVTLDGVLIEDCDDGAITRRFYTDTFLVQNTVIRNVGRTAIRAGDLTWLRNVLIENVDAQDNYLHLTPGHEQDSEQSVVFSSGGSDGSVVLENVTITACDDMRRLFGYNPYCCPTSFSASNVLAVGNTFDMLIENNVGESWSHCYVQEAVEGEGNLLGNDPLFDPERGIPFLAPDSPCIDAGNPDAAYNDIEDPDAPGFALWPSQGGLRNDIGCTGGPYAKDSMFVSVAPATPISLPTSPTLGDAYPNPFNPTTTIPFVIHRPNHLHLAVYNLRGQHIATLADDVFLPGEHRVTFDGSSLASGVYLIHLNEEDVSQTSKVLLLK